MRYSPYLTRSAAERIDAKIGLHPDFPKPGILFRDVSPLLADPDAFAATIATMCAPYPTNRGRTHGFPFNPLGECPTYIAGIESRGFIFGAAMASTLGASFVPIRKKGAKLPGVLHEESYALEYGEATLVLQEGAIPPHAKVVIVERPHRHWGLGGGCLQARSPSGGPGARLLLRDRAGGPQGCGQARRPDPLRASLRLTCGEDLQLPARGAPVREEAPRESRGYASRCGQEGLLVRRGRRSVPQFDSGDSTTISGRVCPGRVQDHHREPDRHDPLVARSPSGGAHRGREPCAEGSGKGP